MRLNLLRQMALVLTLLFPAVSARLAATEKSDLTVAEKGVVDLVPRVAVFPFDLREDSKDLESLDWSIAERLRMEMAENSAVEVIGREELENVLKELKRSVSDLTQKETQMKIGNLVGADLLIGGSTFQKDGKMFLIVKLIHTGNGRVLGASVSGKGEAVTLVPELEKKIVSVLEKETSTLWSSPLSLSGVRKSLSGQVEGKGRTVFLEITEPLSEPGVKCAAEVELGNLLTGLGFFLVETKEAATFQLVGTAKIDDEAGESSLRATGRLRLTLYGPDGCEWKKGCMVETVSASSREIAERTALEQCALALALKLLPCF